MDYFLVFVGGLIIGHYSALYMVRRVLRQQLLRQGVEVREIPELSTEKHGPSIMLYNQSTFMCQGSTIEEVASNLLSIQNIKLAQVRHQNKDIWFVDGRVQTSL